MAEAPESRPLLVVPEWIEAHCVVPDGFRKGRPFLLYDYQFEFFVNFYLVRGDAEWNPADPVLGPAFVYRRALTVGPQKLGKGPKTAAHICVEGVGPALFAGWAGEDDGYVCAEHGCGCGWEYPYEPGEPMGMPWPTPLIQLTAVSEEQTDNVWDALKPMVQLGPLEDVVRNIGEEFIRLPGGGRIDKVTSSALSRLGQRVTFVPQDEVGLWTAQNKMARVADTQYRGLAGMGGRASLDTNAWDPAENSVAQQQWESRSPGVYKQFRQAPKGLSYRNKRERRKIHQAVYGEALRERGGHIDLDSIEALAIELLERDPNQAERFFGNRLVYSAGSWMVDGLWGDGMPGPQPPDGTPICYGFDGSDSDDWTALRAETIGGRLFTPTYGPDRRPAIWNPAEWGGRIPRAEVHAAKAELHARYRIARGYNDPPDWRSEIEAEALEHGDEVVVEWPTYRTVQMHAALERFVTDLTTGALTHDGCPITAIHIANARKLARPGQRYILGKPSQQQKIDAAMASVLAHEAAADARAAGWSTEPATTIIYSA